MRIRRFITVCSLLAWTVPAHAASDYLESLGPGDIHYDLAVYMQARGCTMTEEDMFAFLGAGGADLGMRQAIIIDLARLGDLRWDGKDSYTLVGWGECP
ncbi:MAG: hypothetical protein HC834_02800 [Rhodospirillales bacterium]|nr:hypothetical protein [Rhodospirillales bacterium]